MTSTDLIALLKATAPTDWPRIWSAVYGHREAAVEAVVDELEAALADPKATRDGIRRRVREKAREAIAAEHGVRVADEIRCGGASLGLMARAAIERAQQPAAWGSMVARTPEGMRRLLRPQMQAQQPAAGGTCLRDPKGRNGYCTRGGQHTGLRRRKRTP